MLNPTITRKEWELDKWIDDEEEEFIGFTDEVNWSEE